MTGTTSRRLLGAGAMAAILLPVVMNLLSRPPPAAVDDLVDLGAAGPFEVLPGGMAGRPISAVAKGELFAWTFHYCLGRDLPANEIVELRRASDGRVISRRSAGVNLGVDFCAAGTATQRVPIDAKPGAYELARHLAVRGGTSPATSAMSAIPIEVTP
jgi:hypothetical protein